MSLFTESESWERLSYDSSPSYHISSSKQKTDHQNIPISTELLEAMNAQHTEAINSNPAFKSGVIRR